jgi:hypothetical protein
VAVGDSRHNGRVLTVQAILQGFVFFGTNWNFESKFLAESTEHYIQKLSPQNG